MHAKRIMANLPVADIEAAKGFYTDYPRTGYRRVQHGLGGPLHLRRTARRSVQLVTADSSAPEDSVISVHTDDVDSAYEEAQRLGYEIVHPLTTEPWGVRRFFVRAPDGNVINIVNHRD